MSTEIKIEEHGLNDIFAVVTVYNDRNSNVQNHFPEEINSYLAQGWRIQTVEVAPISTGDHSIAFITLRNHNE